MPGTAHGGSAVGWWPAVPLLVAALLYLAAELRLHRRGARRPVAQRLAAVGGFAVLAVALLPPLSGHGAPFVVHVVGHLLLAMVAAAIRSRAGRASSAPW